jgi:hypothetical protein
VLFFFFFFFDKDTKLGPEGGAAIAEALKVNSTLKFLDLQENQIGSGAKAIAEALKVNTSLQKLILDSNKIPSFVLLLSQV